MNSRKARLNGFGCFICAPIVHEVNRELSARREALG
jgi:hypothetical protein